MKARRPKQSQAYALFASRASDSDCSNCQPCLLGKLKSSSLRHIGKSPQINGTLTGLTLDRKYHGRWSILQSVQSMRDNKRCQRVREGCLDRVAEN